MNIYNSPYFSEHESVNFFYDRESGLKAIIAIHNTNLGTALGGCRFIEYTDEGDALKDVLKLSEGMTYKAAISEIPSGGGKMVIIKSKFLKLSREEIFMKVAKFINTLDGTYITAVDSGTYFEDMKILSKFTPHVMGYKDASIPTSHFTAYSVLNGIKASVEFLYNTKKLNNLKIAIQGLGKAGYALCKYLHDLGAKLYVTDYNQDLINKAVNEFNAIATDVDSIYDLEHIDVLAPCAFGGVINNQTINKLKCRIICGAANNQLANPKLGQILQDRNILYVPDYIANSGGLISVYYENELVNGKSANIFAHIDKVSFKLNSIFIQACKTATSTDVITNEIAKIKFSSTIRNLQ